MDEQKRRYTFGNDEFSLEAAYHDCKLVFDGITDDDSFKEADTGLILYYANEIIYALHEALDKDTNVLSNDCISRQEALDALGEEPLVWTDSEGEIAERSQWRMDVAAIKAVTPVDAVPVVHGKWIHDGYDIPHGVDWMHCSVCGQREPYVPAAMTNYCTNCGARMDEKDGDGNE